MFGTGDALLVRALTLSHPARGEVVRSPSASECGRPSQIASVINFLQKAPEYHKDSCVRRAVQDARCV